MTEERERLVTAALTVARPWQPELTVDEATAGELIAEVAPELADRPLVALGAGWDNTVWAVDGVDPSADETSRFVFRFPRRRLAVGLIGSEVRAMGEIARRLAPVTAVSAPLWHGTMPGPIEGERWPFAGYRYIPGESLAVSVHPRGVELGRVLGRFLRTLHDLDVTAMSERGLEPDPLERLNFTRRWDATMRALDAFAADQRAAVDVHRDLIAQARTLDWRATGSVVCHGDLDGRHVMVGPDGGLCGVIDWGDVCIGSPAIDLALCYSDLEGAGREAFFETYGAISPELAALARARAVMTAARIFGWAKDIDDARFVAHAVASLRRAVAPP